MVSQKFIPELAAYGFMDNSGAELGPCLILRGANVECGSNEAEVGEGEIEEEVSDEGDSEKTNDFD